MRTSTQLHKEKSSCHFNLYRFVICVSWHVRLLQHPLRLKVQIAGEFQARYPNWLGKLPKGQRSPALRLGIVGSSLWGFPNAEVSDCNYILQNASRLFRALFEITMTRVTNMSEMSDRLLEWCKMIDRCALLKKWGPERSSVVEAWSPLLIFD
eukprot:2822453-Amphidinium_carterae.1